LNSAILTIASIGFRRFLMVLSTSATCRLLAAYVSAVMLASASHAQTAAPAPSAFDGYKPYTDEPLANWRAANDTTARIGGWRAYARQAQGMDSKPENMPSPATKAGQAMPETTKKTQP
jgi:hypothetical protein